MLDFENYPVIAAVRSEHDLACALQSDIQCVFLLDSNIMTLGERIARAHAAGKLLFVHMDFAEGIGKDASGVTYLASQGVDGIISTRSHIIAAAKKNGISSVQRFFMIDSRSVDTALESLRQVQPDMIELMPALVYKSIARMKKNIRIPVIAGGLLETKDEIFSALNVGADMVSTANHALWEQ